jgi:hypothetical protein
MTPKPEPETIVCPRNLEHGLARKRWLPREERECITALRYTKVFEIDCPFCGKRELCEDQ